MKLFSKRSKTEAYAVELSEWFLDARPKISRGEEGSWRVAFEPSFMVSTLQWRLIGARSIIVTSEDDGHHFGHPEPVDAEAKANDAIGESRVSGVKLDERTGDLSVSIGGAISLEIVSYSSGYETWQLYRDGEFFGAVGNEGLR